MPRVLFVSKPIAPPFHDGAKCLVRDIATHLTRAEATVMTTAGAPSIGPRVKQLEVYPRAGGFAPAAIDNARVLARLLTGSGHDVWHFVFAPNPVSSMAAHVAKRARRIPTLQTVASAPRSYERIERLLFGDRVVCVSRATADALVKAGASASRIEVIPPPLPPLAPITDEEKRAARLAAGLDPSSPLVVYPGDLEFSSGARRVADAVPAILAGAPGVTVVFACRAKTPRAKAAGEALARELSPFGTRVSFVGEVASLPHLLASTRVVLFPVDDLYGKVDLPIALLEAMALGAPVIALDKGPLAELEGVTHVKENDEGALASLTLELLRDDAAHRDSVAAGRAALDRRHRPETIAAAYEEIYDVLSSA
jgi:phosphatidylinositol alpha-1,6-mannosyltransferase